MIRHGRLPPFTIRSASGCWSTDCGMGSLGLYCKIALGKCNLLFSRITILSNKVTSITGKHDVINLPLAPEPIVTFLAASTKWLDISFSDFFHDSFAFSITPWNLHHSVYPRETVDHNGNVIVMAIAGGSELSKTKVLDPEWYLDRILEQMRLAYEKGVMHGDLREYNIFVSDERVTVIDWPQYVEVEHEVLGL